ncbi:mechanosensitive ion channel family protein [Occallatibacter riparius]|uniref:Mechanosensitive ion channel family protein n=1 Tax=Occallatibacter riparius TaxID=1002689 RepID=A0A9J7BT42_9BACT|nr:mechanosensitive ion channel family protein [Occallatibacter riparius]UWZ86075.1 mechanosensitive ion channel family protein [Occallatibacter riparius]
MAARPQLAAPKGTSAAPTTPAQAEPEKDPLGRTTPKGTILGFLAASHKKNFDLAEEYLDPRFRGKGSEDLIQQFAVVLDKRLPAKLNLISDKPEGSLADPLNPNREVVGRIGTSQGTLAIALERINDKKAGQIWLFDAGTLSAVPKVFEEINTAGISEIMPQALVIHGFLGIPAFEWMVVLLGVPLLWLVAFLLDHGLRWIAMLIWRRRSRNQDVDRPKVLSQPGRLLFVAIAMGALRHYLGLSLLARQIWSDAAGVVFLIALTWFLIRLARWAEGFISLRLRRRSLEGTASILRLGRRLADILVIFCGVIGILYLFGVNVSPALAGLGVGGIAVALAAQKTLENVIGGASIILDQAVNVGDTLKFGTTQGTVEEVGLRSTQVRTSERTLVSVPNGQLATVPIETISARDKFWFHPTFGLEYGTSSEQVRTILQNMKAVLGSHSAIDPNTYRATLIGLGTYSLTVEVSAYVFAPAWEAFLPIQEELLLRLMRIIEEAGSRVALPSQVVIQGRTGLMPESITVENKGSNSGFANG